MFKPIMYESGAKVQCFSFAIDKKCFKDIQKSFTATKMLAMNDYLCLSNTEEIHPIIHLLPGTYEMSFVVMAQHKNVNIAMQGIASQTGTSGLA